MHLIWFPPQLFSREQWVFEKMTQLHGWCFQNSCCRFGVWRKMKCIKKLWPRKEGR